MKSFTAWTIAIDSIVLFAFGVYMIFKRIDKHSTFFNIIALIAGVSLITIISLLNI